MHLRQLSGDADEDAAMLAELFELLTGRAPTPAECRAELAADETAPE